MDLKANLTLRYAVALALVALVLIATHLLSAQRLEAVKGDASLIDESGMQRMLSQRIALLAHALAEADDPQDARS